MDTLSAVTSDRSELLRALDRSMGILVLDADGAILYANATYLSISGYAPEELTGRPHKTLCDAEHVISGAYDEYWEKLRQGEYLSGLLRRRRKNGSEFWLDAVHHTSFSGSGEPERIIKLCIDVTDRVQAMQPQLARMEAADRALIMAEYAPDGTLVSVNENVLTALGCGERELLGKRLFDIFPPPEREAEAAPEIWDFIRVGHIFSALFARTPAGSAPAYIEASLAPVFRADGELEKVIQFGLDVSPRILEEEEQAARSRILALGAEQSGNAVAVTDSANRIVAVNGSFTRMFGYTEREITGKTPACVFGPAEKTMLGRIRRTLDEGGAYNSEEMTYGRNGRRLWVSFLAAPVYDANGRRTHAVSTFTDITNTKLSEILQRKTLEALGHDMPAVEVLDMVCREVEHIAPDVRATIHKKDAEGRLYVFSAPGQMNRGVPDQTGKRQDGFTATDARAGLTRAIVSGSGRELGTVELYRNKPGKPDSFLKRVIEVMARLCSIVLEREESRADMRRLTFYDPVTGLPNRDLLLAAAERTIATISPHFEMPFAFMCLNVDRFKRIQAASDHDASNEVLRLVARRLGEIKGAEDIVAHMAGDEFVIFLTNCDASRALDVGRRVQALLSAPCRVNDVELALNATVGVSLYPDNGRNVERLISRAGTAMLQGKRAGRGQLRFFNEELHSGAGEALSFESRLRDVIRQEKLHLNYQPQINLQTGCLYGVEALCRWQDPELGAISPARFIPLAEESGLIAELSAWVWRDAIRQLGSWRSQGLDIPTISINLSSSNFHDARLPDLILACLDEHGLKPKDLILELTESVLLDDDPSTMATIRRAHDLGLMFSLDDFGTGYSSLSYLRNLPISEIKLDQCFVRDLHQNETSRRLSQAVVRIGESLELPVLAEGIENKRQLSILRQQQCHAIQGYLISKPLPAAEFSRWLANWRPERMQDHAAPH